MFDELAAARRSRRATRPRPRSARSPPTTNRNGDPRRASPPRSADPGWTRTGAVPFSSARKWSAASVRRPRQLGDRRARDGAGPTPRSAGATRGRRARRRPGSRTLLLARVRRAARRRDAAAADLDAGRARAVRGEGPARRGRDAAPTSASRACALKVISGDNPRTVGAVAARVGLPTPASRSTPASCPRTRTALADVLETHSVFGRVTPQQKRAMVGALQSRGPRRRDDRRRRERRAGAEGRRHRRGHGLGRGRDPVGGAARAARRQVRDAARRGRRGPAGHRQHRARRRTCSSPRRSTRRCFSRRDGRSPRGRTRSCPGTSP